MIVLWSNAISAGKLFWLNTAASAASSPAFKCPAPPAVNTVLIVWDPGSLLFIAVFEPYIYHLFGNDGRNGMLVNQLFVGIL